MSAAVSTPTAPTLRRAAERFARTPKGLLLLLFAPLAIVAVLAQDSAAPAPVLVAALTAAAVDLAAERLSGGRWFLPTGALLTGMIVAFVLSPVEPWPVQAATAAIAIASKRVLRAGSANIFNPAALALVVAAIAFGSGHAWWGALPEVGIVGVAILLAIGWVVADYVNKVPLVLAFLGTYFAAFTAVTFVGNAATVTEIFTTPDVQAVLFFALFMLDDPPTSPPRYVDQVLFALIVAVGAFLAFMLFGVQYYLFAGLLIGNAWEALRRAATRRLPRATAG